MANTGLLKGVSFLFGLSCVVTCIHLVGAFYVAFISACLRFHCFKRGSKIGLAKCGMRLKRKGNAG